MQVIATNAGGKVNGGTNIQNNNTIVLDEANVSNIGTKLSGGWNISLEPKKWVFLRKNTDLINLLKLKFLPGSGSSFTTSNQARVRFGSVVDGGSYSTNWSISSVQGFFTVWCPPRDALVDKNY